MIATLLRIFKNNDNNNDNNNNDNNNRFTALARVSVGGRKGDQEKEERFGVDFSGYSERERVAKLLHRASQQPGIVRICTSPTSSRVQLPRASRHHQAMRFSGN
jgi:hypothetical protein